MDDDDPLLDDHNVIEFSSSNENIDQNSIESIREWLIWSYLNVIFGTVILGIIAIGCSFRTHKFKRRQNYKKAYKWSHVTFAVNFIATLSGLTIFGYLIFLYFRNISNEQKKIMGKNLTVSPIHP